MTNDSSRSPSTAAALDGVRVLDLTRVLAGPWCTQLLADLGAEVIKVERPEGGDDTRSWGPPFLKDRDGHDTTDAAYFLAANRGKKSITLDISSASGQQAIRRLVAQCDIVVENFRVGQLARYGMDFESLRAIRPDLIYCSITGFGQTGPWAQRAGYDFIVQGLAGFMSVTGERDDVPGGGPQKAGIAISDLFTGIYACVAILAALHHRQRTGEGQHLDLSLMDTMVSTMANMNTNFLTSGIAPGRSGNAHVSIVPYQTFACADGHVILAVGNDGQFRKFCAVAGRPELAEDQRFATNPQRVRNRLDLVPVLEELMRTRTREQWIDVLEAAGVPCGPINRLDEVFENPQVMARGLLMRLPHYAAGEVELVANPIRMSRTPPRYELAPPRLGEHNEEILHPSKPWTEFDDRR